MLDKCIYCGEDIYPDDESCSNYIGQSHIECAEREDPEELNQAYNQAIAGMYFMVAAIGSVV